MLHEIFSIFTTNATLAPYSAFRAQWHFVIRNSFEADERTKSQVEWEIKKIHCIYNWRKREFPKNQLGENVIEIRNYTLSENKVKRNGKPKKETREKKDEKIPGKSASRKYISR